MVQQNKVQFVQDLTEKLQKAKSLVLADYSGLTVPQQEELRKKAREAGGEFTVVKNTLLKRALGNKVNLEANLQGPTALMMAFEDELAPIKALVSFSEEFEVLQIKAGVFEGQAIEKEIVIDLAKMPGQDQLRIQLVNLLHSPFQRLAQALNSDIRKLVFIISSIEKGGEKNDGKNQEN